MFRPLYPLLIAMALSPSVATAQTPPPTPQPAAREDAVIACLTHVRQSVPRARLDAYVTTRGPVKMSGGGEEQARFKECLRERGHALEQNGAEWSPAKK